MSNVEENVAVDEIKAVFNAEAEMVIGGLAAYAQKTEELAELMLKHPFLRIGKKGEIVDDVVAAFNTALWKTVCCTKGCPAYAYPERYLGQQLEDACENYRWEQGDIWDAILYAKEKYGISDRITGERIPFMLWCNHLLGLRRWDRLILLERQKNPLQFDLKQMELCNLIKKVAARSGEDLSKKKFGYISYDKANKLLKEYGANEEEYKMLNAILDCAFSINIGACEDDEVVNSGSLLGEIQSYSNYLCETVSEGKVDSVFAALIDAAKNGENAENIEKARNVITLACLDEGLDFFGDTKVLYEIIENKELRDIAEDEIKHHGMKYGWQVRAYSKYCNLKPRATRNRVYDGESFLREMCGKLD